jgi:hypothetical protein
MHMCSVPKSWHFIVRSRQVYQISCRLEFGTTPNHRREQAYLCPINCMLELAQPQLQKWARCSTAVFSFNVYVQREAVTSSSCSWGYNCHAPLPENCLSTSFATVYSKLAGGREGWCVSECPAYQALALCMFGLRSVVFSGISHHP